MAWDNSARKAVLQGRSKLTLTIGSKTMQKNNENIVMDVAPLIANPGRTMLPARYVAEGLGFKVEWDAAKQLVIAYPEDQPKPDIENILKELNNSSITVQDLGNATGDQNISAAGYNLFLSSSNSNPTMFFNIGDSSWPKQNIRVVCTSHPEFNTCHQQMINGQWRDFRKDVWTNNYMLFRDGYTSNPKSGMTVTFDIYGGYNGDESYEGVKIATIRKTLP
nr:copper amine oxidase N-terminal domain-containing protein [Syntrophomonas palmitatica]